MQKFVQTRTWHVRDPMLQLLLLLLVRRFHSPEEKKKKNVPWARRHEHSLGACLVLYRRQSGRIFHHHLHLY